VAISSGAFSKHGNLKQTIIALITESPKGLSAGQIARLVDLVPNSSYLSHLKDAAGVKREKHQGRFVYLSGRPEIYARQRRDRTAAGLPTDAQAVVILVQLIKHPDIDIEQLAEQVSEQGPSIEPAAITNFLQLHDLLKNFGYKAVTWLRYYTDKMAREHSAANLFEQNRRFAFIRKSAVAPVI